MTKLNQEQIDNYHAGRMSESEATDFERLLESDPAIKTESDFQSDIVSGLKEFRKLELKSRLDAINVGPTWIEFAQQSALMKSLGGVIVASIIGTGIYFYGDRSEAINPDYPVTVEKSPEMESIDFVWELGNEDASNEGVQLEKPQLVESERVPEDVAENSSVAELAAEVQESKEEVFRPSFEAPDVDAVEDEEVVAAKGLDEIPESTGTSPTGENPIDVQSEINKSSSIKYKYYDGKLFLSGDFDKAPYEILEINSANGRRIYVYYLGSFYKVGLADKLTQLPEVKDQEVIKELKLLRENK